jgi:hypothetical protein
LPGDWHVFCDAPVRWHGGVLGAAEVLGANAIAAATAPAAMPDRIKVAFILVMSHLQVVPVTS